MSKQAEQQLELGVTRAPGRPCLGDVPLTPAQKQARYRARQHQNKVTVTINRDDVVTLSSVLMLAEDFAYRRGIKLDGESVQRLIAALDDACGGKALK